MKILNINKISLTVAALFIVSMIPRIWGITNQFEVWDETAVVRTGEIYLNLWKHRDFSKESSRSSKTIRGRHAS